MTAIAWVDEPFLEQRYQRLGAGRPVERSVFHGDFVGPSLRADDRAIVQKPADRRGVERGRHDDQNQIGADLAADFAQERQREVAVQVALVKLVEDDGTDPFEERVGQELAGEDALGQESERGLCGENRRSKRTW